jgi:hypothetical protein
VFIRGDLVTVLAIIFELVDAVIQGFSVVLGPFLLGLDAEVRLVPLKAVHVGKWSEDVVSCRRSGETRYQPRR